MTTKRGIAGLLVVVIAAAGLIYLLVNVLGTTLSPQHVAGEVLDRLDTPANPEASMPRDFVVREGDTAAAVAERLEEAGLVENALVFRMMAEMENATTRLSAGEYELAPSMKPSEILTILVEGRTRPELMVTFPEGWRAEEIADRMTAARIGSSERFMELLHDYRGSGGVVSQRPAGASLEGYLFPSSYSFTKDTTVEEMLERMVEQFETQFTPEMKAKADALGMSVHEIVTLASIIEREAVVPSERPVMAGVFYNRLKAGMKLQTDPTVQYALASSGAISRAEHGWWKTELSMEDLQIDSPYNTYLYEGLPPGPICNPGLDSIRAALEPAETDYLYFVARPDGSHDFSVTLEEHNEKVALYQRD